MKYLLGTKIYVFQGGGQKVRQLLEGGAETIRYQVRYSDWPAKHDVYGVDSYTQELWSHDFESFSQMIENWAGRPVELKQTRGLG